ncbi:GTPase IMAP family member 4-like [Mytilus edulis]|uniref:GTPase IMAP family member 4-like n=1 Tax=Mytilus edulis TaxID=6550 RepID=UPI0039EEA8FF
MESKQSRIILFGRPGAGKSSLGNTLIGKQHFKVSSSSSNVTPSCDTVQVKTESGRNLKIVETPGISDRSMIDEFRNSFDFLSPGPHAIIIVLMPNRFTEEDEKAVNKLFEFFGDDHFLRNTVLVINRKSEITEDYGENPNSTEYIENISSNGIQKLYNGCDKRFVLVENKQEWEDRLVDANQVLQEIDKINDYYDWKYFDQVNKQIESLKKIKKLEAEVERLNNMMKEERKKKNEHDNIDAQSKCSVN